MKRRNLIARLLVLCLSFCLIACSTHSDSMSNISVLSHEEEKPENLVVYLSASSFDFISQEGESAETYYPSEYTMGTMRSAGEFTSPRGNIFERAITEYSEQTGIPIEVHYLEEYTGPSHLLQEMVDQGETLPDLMIFPKFWRYDYALLAEQGLLLDFTPYAEADERLQNEEAYYQPVLEGGVIHQKQYGMPLLFNLSGMITSQSFLNYAGVSSPSQGVTYEEIMMILEKSCLATTENTTKEAIYELSGWMPPGLYIPSILLGSAYTRYYDEESQNWRVEEEFLTQILSLMQTFNRQEFCSIPGWEERSFTENIGHSNIKSFTMFQTPEDIERIGIFLSGGRSGGRVLHNSLLTDLAFFNTVYQQQNEELVFCGIPTLAGGEEYAANISLCAFGAASTRYPQAVYDLTRYLMDYAYPAAYGFSVNREVTDRQLESIQTMSTKMFPSILWSQVFGGYAAYEEIENEAFVVNPLDEQWVQSIRYMLDHMAGASLPFGLLEYYLLWYAQCAVGTGDMTAQEGAAWIMERLKEYMESRGTLKPFYDSAYLNTLAWVED